MSDRRQRLHSNRTGWQQRLLPTLLLLTLTAPPVAAADQDLNAVLQQARQGAQQALADAQTRRRQFLADRDQQQTLLEQARAELAALHAEATTLETSINDGRQQLGQLREQLELQAGDLRAGAAVVRRAAGGTLTRLRGSLLSAQFPDPLATLETLASGDTLPNVTSIEQLWLIQLQELVESGNITRFQAPVVGVDGRSRPQQVLRVGVFDAVSEQGFVALQQGRLHLLPRQPGRSRLATAKRYAGFEPTGTGTSISGLQAMVIDPSRGEWLDTLALTPTPMERLHQGGAIGYLILGLATIGLLVGLWRLMVLALQSRRVERQLRQPQEPKDDNPLGRVLAAYPDSGGLEDIELQLHEAVLREIPRLSRGQTLLKLLAAVTPLLGLLGTVTGMVLTFQAISLFGSSDPRLMADGISQALMTTILGLGSAIPLLFLHSGVSTRSRALIQVLDQESAGLVVHRQLQAQQPTASGDGL